jgi:hypothetical protein
MFRFFKAITNWLDRQLKDNSLRIGSVLRIRFGGNSLQRIEHVLAQSAHDDMSGLTAEAFKVSETIYKHGLQGRTVYCEIVNGKIEMSIDDPDGGGGIPVEEESVVVQLFSRAA